MKQIIFTDLDDTLLDHDTYSYKEASEALGMLKKKKIPLIICTSKTRSEIEFYRKKFGNQDPFISENGGAIFIPKTYFDFPFKYDKEDKHYFIIQLGTNYQKLVHVLRKIKIKYPLRMFSGMAPKQLADESGLTLQQAKLAKQREFDEAFQVLDPKDQKKVLAEIKASGLRYTVGGRYVHIIGNSDKGKAVKMLSALLRKKFGIIETVGLGDSENDFAMLDTVDQSYLVMKKNRRYASKKYKRAGGIGPAGWQKAILKLLK